MVVTQIFLTYMRCFQLPTSHQTTASFESLYITDLMKCQQQLVNVVSVTVPVLATFWLSSSWSQNHLFTFWQKLDSSSIFCLLLDLIRPNLINRDVPGTDDMHQVNTHLFQVCALKTVW